MSFDLYVFDLEGTPTTLETIHGYLGDDSAWGAPPTPRVGQLLDELETRYPSLEDDELEDSPWASWPLRTQTVADGLGCAFNIIWPRAEDMHSDMVRLCAQHHLTLYNPQTDEITGPPPKPKPSRWRRLFGR